MDYTLPQNYKRILSMTASLLCSSHSCAECRNLFQVRPLRDQSCPEDMCPRAERNSFAEKLLNIIYERYGNPEQITAGENNKDIPDDEIIDILMNVL